MLKSDFLSHKYFHFMQITEQSDLVMREQMWLPVSKQTLQQVQMSYSV